MAIENGQGDFLDIVKSQYSPRVAAIVRILLEEHFAVDAIRTGNIAFHFTENSEVKTKLSNDFKVTMDGSLAVRST